MSALRICTECKRELSTDCFYKCSKNKNGLQAECKDCHKARYVASKDEVRVAQKKYYEKNKDKKKQYAKDYHSRNKDKHDARNKEYSKVYVVEKSKERKETCRKYYENNKAKIKETTRIYKGQRWETDAVFRLLGCLRGRLRSALRSSKKVASTLSLVGCTKYELMLHLMSSWYDHPGSGESMTWKNYGQHGWHVDHIRPCVSFNFLDPEQQKQCFHYSNLQPLWAQENRAKHAKLNWEKGKHL